jgi:predicted helicase
MAQLIVEDTVTHHTNRILDPACGSGAFLVLALKKKVQLLAKQKEITSTDATRLLDDVWGIDVNLLSVTLARTNLYLTTVNLLKGRQQPAEIRPHVYVADTFVLPRFTDEEQRQLTQGISTSPIISAPVTPQISIPILSRLSPDEATHWINVVGEALESGSSTVPSDKKTSADLIEFQRALLQAMRDLRKKYGDNLWKFVLRNYGIPPLLRRSFDVVVGNPPWLSFREARESIKKTMETIATQYGVRPGVQTKTSFNLAVTFFLASSYFVKSGGCIGFVFPLSVLDGAAHAPFIDLLMSGNLFQLRKAYDLEDIAPNPFPHNLPSSILIVEVKK